MFQTIIPRDKQHWLDLRKPLVTSTEVAALFGCSPYLTEFELFHRKRDNLPTDFEPNERMVWGSRLEKSIAEGVAEDEKFKIRKMDEFMFDPELRLGSSFDYAIDDDGILEVKNVDSLVYRDGWITEWDNTEGPLHIEIQVQVELLVSGRKYAKLAAFVGGNRVVIIHRDRDDKVCDSILLRVKQFWNSIDNNIEPEPDFKRDAAFISKLYKYAAPGKVMDATGNALLETLVKNYKKAGDAAKLLDEEKKGYKAQMLTIIGDAEKVIAPGFSISAGIIGPTHVEYEREGYRDFRSYIKKEKK